MKLRQKLAAVLATAMIVTSIPVVTMAQSSNKLSTVVKVSENAALTGTTAPALRINLEDYDKSSAVGEVFYLKLENAEWNGAVNDTVAGLQSGVTATITSKTEMKVAVGAGITSLSEIRIPLETTVKTGEAKVSIVNKGGTTVSNETFVFATTSDKLVNVSVDKTIPSFYKGGEIADILLEEAYKDAFAAPGVNKIQLTIQNDDFIFDTVGTPKLEYGFSNSANNSVDLSSMVAIQTDKQVLEITLPNGLTADSIGQLRLKGIKVKSTSKTPELGELKIDVTGKCTTEQRDVVVGKITEYGNTLAVKEDKVVEIVAGQSKAVEFTLSENVEDSMVKDREVEFKLDKGYFAVEVKDDEVQTKQNLIDQITSIKNDNTEVTIADVIEDVIVEDEKVVGFTMKLPATEKIDKFNFKANVFVGLEESGEVKLSVSGRGIGEEISKVIVNAKKSIDVTSEVAVIKTGLKGQKAGKITITETEKEMIKKGNVEIVLPYERGITFAAKPEVKVTGDLQVGKVTIEDVENSKNQVVAQKVVIPVTRASKTASTIEIANFTIDTDRTVAEGKYDVKVGGEALTSNADSIKVEDFITIGTANTEDLVGSNGLAKGTSTFVIGENKYTINGVEKQMDACSYIEAPGYTMVPVRYVAEAFGITGNNIMFAKGTATIFAGNRTIQLTNNSDVAIVNGVQVKLATKVVMKDGRTYAPIGEVAQLLGVSKEWNNETKTATFTNK